MLICVCIGSDLFITLLSIREHTPHVKLLYNSVLVSLIFTVMFSFVSLSVEVHIRSLVRFLHDSSPLGNLLLAWHGRERQKKPHMSISSTPQMLFFKTLSYIVVCLHHVSLLSLLAAAAAWGLECISAGVALYSAEDEAHSGILDDSFHVCEQIYTSLQSLQKERSYRNSDLNKQTLIHRGKRIYFINK